MAWICFSVLLSAQMALNTIFIMINIEIRFSHSMISLHLWWLLEHQIAKNYQIIYVCKYFSLHIQTQMIIRFCCRFKRSHNLVDGILLCTQSSIVIFAFCVVHRTHWNVKMFNLMAFEVVKSLYYCYRRFRWLSTFFAWFGETFHISWTNCKCKQFHYCDERRKKGKKRKTENQINILVGAFHLSLSLCHSFGSSSN